MPEPGNRPRKRREDFRLTSGASRYVDDVRCEGALHGAFVRADHAAARVLGIDGSAALEAGAVAVLTAADLAADGVSGRVPPLRVERPDGTVDRETRRPLLVEDRVRLQGEPVAMVLAASRTAALDCAEAVVVDYAPEPAIVTVEQARAEGAPLIWPDRPGNLAFLWRRGNTEAVERAMREAAHVTRVRMRVSRVAANAMEPRGALARPNGDRMEIHVSHQSPQQFRDALEELFGMARGKVRVIAADVGGSFGMKSGTLREECLTFWAARRLGRPVRWTATRSESLLCDEHARDLWADVALALDAEGTFLGLHVAYDVNCGAYSSGRSQAPIGNFGGIAGVYRTPAILGEVRCWFTNTSPTAPYRGAGRPDATYVLERAIDAAAFETGRDPAELRRRNLIPPEAMPYQTPFVFRYDCGDFGANLDRALEVADYAGFPARAREAAARGRLRGIGIANPIEVAAGPWHKPSTDHATLRAEPDGTVTLLSGAMSVGQGLETALSSVAAEETGLPFERIAYTQGDTDLVVRGKGNGGSAALTLGGSAIRLGAAELVSKARELAARLLGLDVGEVSYDAGLLRAAGSNRVIDLGDLARRAQAEGWVLEGTASFGMEQATFPNGCHICEVEIDPETGAVDVLRYVSVEDVGRVINDWLVEGQIHGGVAQGIGQALWEEMAHDGLGQVLSGSFMDYAMPRAADLPMIVSETIEVPTKLNPLGVKGVGEAGTVGALAAAMNAVCNALQARGIRHIDMPATPHRIWTALNASVPLASCQ